MEQRIQVQRAGVGAPIRQLQLDAAGPAFALPQDVEGYGVRDGVCHRVVSCMSSALDRWVAGWLGGWPVRSARKSPGMISLPQLPLVTKHYNGLGKE